MPQTPDNPAPTGSLTTRERTRAIALRWLREQGELVGAQRVRDELGYGSLQTINEELRALRRELATRLERSLALPELPPALAADAAAFLQSWWEQALTQARQESEDERAAWQAKEEGWRQTLAERDGALMELARDREVVERQLEQTEQLVAEQGRSLELLRAELAQLRQQQQVEREAAAQCQQQLEADTQALRDQLEQQARQAASQLTLLNDERLAQQAQHEATVAALRQSQQRELRDQAAQMELLRRKVATQGNELALAQERWNHGEQRREALDAELQASRQALAGAREREQEQQARLGALQQELSRACAERDEARRLFEQLLARPPSPGEPH